MTSYECTCHHSDKKKFSRSAAHRYPIEVVLQSQYHENVHQVSGIRLRRDPQHYPRCFAKEETAQGDQSER